MKHILALDQGTTSSRAIVFNDEGRVVGMAQQEFRQYFPHNGWVEHDPQEIWTSQLKTALDAVHQAGLTAADIKAVGITNQRETSVVWNRITSRPICPAIVWQDRRTADLCSQLKEAGHEPLFQKKTGLLLDPYFSGTKVRWILDHVEGAREQAEAGELCFGTIDSWLIWKLTGGSVHATDATNASRTLLYNIHSGEWDDELLALLNIPKSMLPKVVDSSGVVGKISVFDELNGIPIAGIAGDQQAALFGQACFARGMAKNTYGTGCFLLLNTGNEPITSENRLLTTVACQLNGKRTYALEGSVFIGGAVVQWLRDQLGIIQSAEEIEALAAKVPDSRGVHFVPAFAGLGAPYWEPELRGTISGLTRGTNKAHIARAALDAIAFQSVELLEAMEKDAGIALKELRVDGGACANNLLMQLQADYAQTEVVRPSCIETTALGAAYLAGLATGVWDSKEEIAQHRQADRTFEPEIDGRKAASALDGWRRAIRQCRNY
ncbi:glycerol kinase GlpK [Verrucomicrobiota bacterium]